MIKKLEWDSSFFNTPIYELTPNNTNNSLADELSSVENGIIQCKLNMVDFRQLKTLILHNFLVEGVGITYTKKINANSFMMLDLATSKDKDHIVNISRGLFKNTRFNDDYFGKNSAERLYTYWITAAIQGEYDDCCLVKRNRDGEIVGFVTVKKVLDCLRVGLIGTDINYQGSGIGKDLMLSVEMYAKKNNAKKIIITTQYDNVVARSMFNSMGYYEDSIFYWLYLKIDI
jgi:dTDP-4-amino-4,6-dideoxy-D-galactose acyltransferase